MNDEDKKMNSSETEHKPDDKLGQNMSGHILIKDKETGEEIIAIKEMLFTMETWQELLGRH